MADEDHVARLKGKFVSDWNHWRETNPNIRPNLSEANLSETKLSKANLSNVNLSLANLKGADLSGASLYQAKVFRSDLKGANLHRADLSRSDISRSNLRGADLSGANLSKAVLVKADLIGAHLREVDLSDAILNEADLSGANLSGAKLGGATLNEADLRGANLVGVDLSGARLAGATLSEANLRGANLVAAELSRANLEDANLSGANLTIATLVNTNLTGADITGCRVYGISAWNLTLRKTKQQNLIITQEHEPAITVDNIEVAQFVYLMLHNQKIRDVIDTIGKKGVLILGRFTDERKAVLDALREELRKHDYLPILFDFDVPATRDITETVSLLAHMARFIIADLTDPSSIPKELERIVPDLAVPVQPVLEGSSRPYAMFKDYWKYHWVLPVYRYEGLEPLLTNLAERVIAPSEEKAKALEEQRRESRQN